MRRRVADKRKVIPDPKYGDEVVARFINCIMRSGKKSTAETIVYSTFDQIITKYKGEDDSEGGESGSGKMGAVSIFKKALDNVCPIVEVRSRRVGGATYQIPVEVAPGRQLALGMRWLKEAARSRSEHGMVMRLAAEILDAVAGRGEAVKKREDTHRMAKANQAFAHYRWN